MKIIRLFLFDFRRLLCSRATWLVIFTTVISPVAGLVLYKPAVADTMLSMYLANPAIAGGVTGGILFGLLSVFELDRSNRSRVNVLTDAAVSPLTLAFVRLMALTAAALLALCITMVAWLPVSRWRMGSVFNGIDYVLAYLLFMGLALPLTILFASAAYQFTMRSDLSVILLIVFASVSLTVWADKWQHCWLNPCVWALSDDFSNFRIYRSVAFMRFTWLAALGGLWMLSYLCVRQYGKGLFGSMIRSVRRVYRPVIALTLLVCSGVAYAAQPFVDQSNPDQTAMTLYEIPYLEEVVCVSRTARLFPNTAGGFLNASAAYRFENTSGREQIVAFGINPGYTVSSVMANGVEVPFSVGDYQEYNEAVLNITIPSEEQIDLSVEYGGFPREDRNVSYMQGTTEISAEYLCLENADLAPRLLNVEAKDGILPAAMEITLPESMTVIPFGLAEPEAVSENDNGTITWRYEDMGASGILYAGDYVCENVEAGGILIQLYYGRKHQKVMEEAEASLAVRTVADYCTKHYGPLFYGMAGSLKLIQSRVSGGGYASIGASMMDESDFTAANLNNRDKGAIPGEVMIHELVHQWWGLGIMIDITDESSPWSPEGLTVYTTYRIVRDLYGEDYATEHYVNRWREAVDDYYLNFYVRHPEYLKMLPEQEQMEITNSLISVRRYSEMPLKIRKAEELVGGEEEMDRILYELFNQEPDPMFPYLTYQAFLDACGLGEEDLNLE